MTDQWLPIETAPKDRPIVGLCRHDADPYYETETRLTVYGGHCEALGHIPDGPHVMVWGGAYGDLPNWWFRYGSFWEEPVSPTHWAPIPLPLEPQE